MNFLETERRTNLILLALIIVSGMMSVFEAEYAHQVAYYLFLALTPLTIYYVWVRNPANKLSLSSDIPLWGFAFFSALSLVWTINIYESLSELYKIIFYVLLYYLAAAYLTRKDVNKLVFFLVLIGTFIAFIGILLYLFVKTGRIISVFNNPNPLGIYLAMLSLLNLGIYLMDSENKWWTVSFVILTDAMILTGSRGSILAYIISLMILFFLLPRKNLFSYFKKCLILFSLVAVSVYLISIAAPWIQEMGWRLDSLNRLVVRDSSLSSGSVVGRLSFWQVAWGMIMARPLTGFGVGTYHWAYNTFRNNDQYWSMFCHNNYLQMWAESGLGALLAFILFFSLFYFFAYKYIKTHHVTGIYLGIIVAGLAFLMHTFVDFSWNMPSVTVLFWILLGCAQAIKHYDDSEEFQGKETRKTPLKYALVLFLLIISLGIGQLLTAYHIARWGEEVNKLGQQKQALDKYLLAARILPFREEHFAMISKSYDSLYQKTKDPLLGEKSLEYRLKAISLSPFEHENYRLMGVLLLRHGSDEAEYYFEKAVELGGFTPTPYADLGYYYILKDQREKGEKVLVKGLAQSKWAYKNAPGEKNKLFVQGQIIRMHLGLAAIYHERQDYDLEKNQLEEIILLDPDNVQVKDKLKNL